MKLGGDGVWEAASRRALPLIVPALILAACDPGNEPFPIGFSRDANMNVVIHFETCSREVITRVAVQETRDAVVDADDPTYWEMKGRSRGQTEFTVGTVPAGLAEVVPLRQALPESRELAAVIETEEFDTVGAFSVSMLREDRILAQRDWLTPEEFSELGLRRCQVPEVD